MFMELEANGKNQNEIMDRNKHLSPTVPSGVTSASGTTAQVKAPSVPKAGRHFAWGTVWPWRWVSASQNSYQSISHEWKQHALLGWFSILGARAQFLPSPGPGHAGLSV